MTHTPPSEAAASSPDFLSDDLLSDAELRKVANPNGCWSPPVRAMAREILRLHAQCPSKADSQATILQTSKPLDLGYPVPDHRCHVYLLHPDGSGKGVPCGALSPCPEHSGKGRRLQAENENLRKEVVQRDEALHQMAGFVHDLRKKLEGIKGRCARSDAVQRFRAAIARGQAPEFRDAFDLLSVLDGAEPLVGAESSGNNSTASPDSLPSPETRSPSGRMCGSREHQETPSAGLRNLGPAAAAELMKSPEEKAANQPTAAEIEKLRAELAAAEGHAQEKLLPLLWAIDSALSDAGRHRARTRIGMGDEVERIRDLAGERDAWKHKADTLGGDLNRIRSLVPIMPTASEQTTFEVVQAELQRLRDLAERNGKALTEEAQTAIAAMRDVGPELAKAGIHVGQRCSKLVPPLSHAEAVAQLRGERDRWREKFEAAHQIVDEAARFEGAVVADLAAHGVFATGGIGGVRFAVGKVLAELARLRKESKRDQVTKQQALLDEIARLFPGKGDLLGRVQKAASGSIWRERLLRLRDGIKAQLAWCTLPGGAPFAGMHEAHAALSCALRNADALMAEASNGGAPLPGDWCGTNRTEAPPMNAAAASKEDNRKQLLGELAQVVNRHSLEYACGDTPDFLVAELMLDAAMAFGRFTRGREAHATGRAPHVGPAVGGEVPNWLEAMRRTEPKRDVVLAPIRSLVDEAVRSLFERRSCKEPKVGPATGQPRTEVSLDQMILGDIEGRGPHERCTLTLDETGNVVGNKTTLNLGKSFHLNLSNAVACLPDGEPDPTTIKIAIRNLHACVAELAKVVERIGAR